MKRNQIVKHYKSFFDIENISMAKNDHLMIYWAEQLIKDYNNLNANTHIISGCTNCPFCDMNDFCAGYTCQLDKKNIIKEDKNGIAITPKWCPIKKYSIIMKYGKEIKKTN